MFFLKRQPNTDADWTRIGGEITVSDKMHLNIIQTYQCVLLFEDYKGSYMFCHFFFSYIIFDIWQIDFSSSEGMQTISQKPLHAQVHFNPLYILLLHHPTLKKNVWSRWKIGSQFKQCFARNFQQQKNLSWPLVSAHVLPRPSFVSLLNWCKIWNGDCLIKWLSQEPNFNTLFW